MQRFYPWTWDIHAKVTCSDSLQVCGVGRLKSPGLEKCPLSFFHAEITCSDSLQVCGVGRLGKHSEKPPEGSKNLSATRMVRTYWTRRKQKPFRHTHGAYLPILHGKLSRFASFAKHLYSCVNSRETFGYRTYASSSQVSQNTYIFRL